MASEIRPLIEVGMNSWMELEMKAKKDLVLRLVLKSGMKPGWGIRSGM